MWGLYKGGEFPTLLVPRNRGNIALSDAEMGAILATIPMNDVGAHEAFLSDARFFPGIARTGSGRAVDPQESLADYERVLGQVRRVDPARFAYMHKGTPYYIMGWLGYSMRDYESGVFYMDAALSEDHKNNPNWQETPAAAFIFLNPLHPDAAANAIVAEIREEVDAIVSRFAAVAGIAFTTESLVNRFIKPKAHEPTHRSIVTAMLTFMLEGKQRLLQTDLRSAVGGTLEPFLTHLFKGGLIFESILKTLYHGTPMPTPPGGAAATMGAYLRLPAARGDLQLSPHAPVYDRLPRSFTFNDVLNALPGWRGQPFAERAVAIAYSVRNTSGHDLGWPANLDRAIYQELYEGVTDAILWVVGQKYP